MNNYFPGAMYVISMSLGVVLLGNVITQIPPILSLLMTSIFAVIFFHIISRNKLKDIYRSAWRSRREWLIINILVGIMWLGTYYSVKWLNPTAFLFLFFISLTAMFHLRQFIAEKQLNRNVFNFIIPLIFIVVYGLFYHTNYLTIFGIAAGVVSGITGSYYNTVSKSFAINSGLTASDVLATRFYLIILLALCFLKAPMFVDVNILNILKLILVSIFTFILPLYMSQRSLMQLAIDKHTQVIAVTPLAAYFFQGLFMNQWSVLLLIMSSMAVLFLIFSQYKNRVNQS